MKVYVAVTAYDDGVTRTPHFVRTHGIYSNEKDALKKIKELFEADLKAWETAVDHDGNSRAMERYDGGYNDREIFIRNDTESVTYRVVMQDISIGFGEY